MTKEELDRLSIYELRALARHTGVASPTSKRKEDLIREILEINAGTREKYVAKTRQGRPPKNFVGYGFSNIYMPQPNNRFFYPDRLPSAYASLAQKQAEFIYGEDNSFTGYVEFLQNGSIVLRPYMLSSREVVAMPIEFAEQYNLRAGDIIMCEILPSTIDAPAVCKEVCSINNRPIKEYSTDRLDYFEIKHTRPTKPLVFKDAKYDNIKVLHGQNVYIYGASNDANSVSLIHLLNSVTDAYKIYINPAIAEKNRPSLDELKNAEEFVSPITADVDDTMRILNLAINRAHRLLELGERAVVVIDDIKTIANMDENLFITKQLLSLTKEGNNGSITVIALLDNDANFNIALDKMCDKSFDLDDNVFTPHETSLK